MSFPHDVSSDNQNNSPRERMPKTRGRSRQNRAVPDSPRVSPYQTRSRSAREATSASVMHSNNRPNDRMPQTEVFCTQNSDVFASTVSLIRPQEEVLYSQAPQPLLGGGSEISSVTESETETLPEPQQITSIEPLHPSSPLPIPESLLDERELENERSRALHDIDRSIPPGGPTYPHLRFNHHPIVERLRLSELGIELPPNPWIRFVLNAGLFGFPPLHQPAVEHSAPRTQISKLSRNRIS